MVKKTISQQSDGIEVQKSNAFVAFEQDGETFFGRTRPNPDGLLNIRNQPQLEAELGEDLEIADNERVTISLDSAVTLTKPIKLGLNSAVEVFQSTNKAFLTYTGVGALFQNTNPANLITDVRLHNIQITGNGTNSLFDVVGTSIVEAKDAVFSTFASLGTINNPFTLFDSCSFVNLTQGLKIINPSNVSVTRSSIVQFASTGMTAFTIKTNVVSIVDINFARALSFFAGDSLVFFDPNFSTGSIYSIEKSNVVAGDLYQLGTDIAINSVADNGSGDARFTTASSHGLVVGKAVVLSAFGVETTYNGTFIVTAVDTPITGFTFDIQELPFTGNDTGNMNASSLDNTDPIVFAEGNNGTPDSRTISESSINGVLEVDGSGGVDVPIIDITPVVGDWNEDPSTEGFSVDPVTGLVTYIGVNVITAMIKYSSTVDATSGASQTIELDLHINGISQTKTLVTAITPATVVYNGGNFVINPGDTFQLFKDNMTNTNNTNVSATTLLINKD